MPTSGPFNAIPSCPATPRVGFGSNHYGYSSDYGYRGLGTGYDGSTSAASLGVLDGADPRCIVQVPPQEATIQPPPFVVVLPGAILSATSEPIRIGGYAPCAHPGSGSGFDSGSIGYGNLGLRSRSLGLGYSGLNSRGLLRNNDYFSLNSCYDVCH